MRAKIEFDILQNQKLISQPYDVGMLKITRGILRMGIYLSQSFLVGMLFVVGPFPAAIAAEVAEVPAEYALAEQAMDEQDLNEAAIHFRKAAEQNYLPAQTALGELMYASEDFEESFGWFLMSAYQGDAAGAYDLGKMYAEGNGVEKNLSKAVYWITHAAEKNYLPAAENLAVAYREGLLGLAKDPDQAKIWESRLPGLRAASQKELVEKLAALKAAQREARKAALKEAAEKKEAAKKAENEAAAKKVDDADVATTKSAADNTVPVKAK